MAEDFKLVFNRVELDRLLTSTEGPIAEDLAQRAERVAESARRRAPKKTGKLAASIGYEIGVDNEGLYAEVGSSLEYARSVEQGHRAEDGTQVSPRRYLRPALRDARG